MKIFRLNYMIVWLLCCTTAIAQTKKLDKNFKTNSNVTVSVDATHTNIVVEHWDRNEVQVEALLDAQKADEQEINKALKNWKLDLTGSAGEVTIRSTGGMEMMKNIDMSSIQEPLSKLPEMMAPLQEMMGPLLENIAGNPLPPQFYESMGELNFDYEAYRKDGDKYLEKWEKKVEKNFGKDFKRSMEEWARNFEKDSALWKSRVVKIEKMGEKFEKDMEAWGEKFGKSMEVWGEQFGKEMETWAKNVEKEVESEYGDSGSKIIVINKGSKAQKTIKIKIPREGQLKLNVRHGDVKLSGNVKNLEGNITHSKLSANRLSGDRTDLKVAYSPVHIKQWDYGMLKASYVQDFEIGKAESIKLTSNSSDVTIKELMKEGIFRGTFGELVIDKVGDDFNSLDIVLENSDLKLDLPNVPFNFNFSGNKSQVNYPGDLSVKSTKSYDTQKLTGYNRNKNANASISISASFSDVVLK